VKQKSASVLERETERKTQMCVCVRACVRARTLSQCCAACWLQQRHTVTVHSVKCSLCRKQFHMKIVNFRTCREFSVWSYQDGKYVYHGMGCFVVSFTAHRTVPHPPSFYEGTRRNIPESSIRLHITSPVFARWGVLENK